MFHSWGLSIHMSWLGLTQTRISSRVCLKLRMCSSWVRVTVWLVKTLDHHAATLQNVAWKWDWHTSAQLQRKSISTWLDTTSCPSTGNWNTNGCSLQPEVPAGKASHVHQRGPPCTLGTLFLSMFVLCSHHYGPLLVLHLHAILEWIVGAVTHFVSLGTLFPETDFF